MMRAATTILLLALAPLTLAAAAVAAGFLSFTPTAYRGVSELGQIAGMGMFPDLDARRIGAPVVRRDMSAVFAVDRSPTPVALKFLSHCRETLKRAPLND